MAFARIIRQNFHNHPEVASNYTIEEKYLLIGLAFAADDFGKLWDDEANIKSVIFPTDDVPLIWVRETINKFIAHKILCPYNIDNINYIHFPLWFEEGWFLKQRIDHPREYQQPDCPECNTEAEKWNELYSSRLTKANRRYEESM